MEKMTPQEAHERVMELLAMTDAKYVRRYGCLTWRLPNAVSLESKSVSNVNRSEGKPD